MFLSMFITVLAIAALAVAASGKPDIVGREVDYSAGGVLLKGYFAYDKNIRGRRPGPGPRPGPGAPSPLLTADAERCRCCCCCCPLPLPLIAAGRPFQLIRARSANTGVRPAGGLYPNALSREAAQSFFQFSLYGTGVGLVLRPVVVPAVILDDEDDAGHVRVGDHFPFRPFTSPARRRPSGRCLPGAGPA